MWDYEYFKPLGCIELPKNVEPTALGFVNGLNILIIAGNNGKIYFVLIKIKDFSHSDIILLFEMSLFEKNIPSDLTYLENSIDEKDETSS